MAAQEQENVQPPAENPSGEHEKLVPAASPASPIRPLTRATLILFTATLALLLTRYLILPHLPDSLHIHQQIGFDLSNIETAPTRWPGFAQKQFLDIEEICQTQMPRLHRHLKITSPRPGALQINGTFNAATHPGGPISDINQLAQLYIDNYTRKFEALNPNDDQLPEDYSEKALRQWIQEQNRQHTALQTRFVTLLDEYSKLAVKLIGAEHRLEMASRTITQPNSDEEFETFAAQPLAQQLNDDPELAQLRDQLNQIDTELMLLENKATRNNGNPDTLALDRRILELKLQKNDLLQRRKTQTDKLTAELRQTLWNQYAQTLKQQADDTMKQIRANNYQREMLQATLNQTQKRLDFVQSFLPEQPSEPNQNGKKLAELILQDFLPPLARQQFQPEIKQLFSAIQIASLFSSILLGAALGFLIRLPKRTPDHARPLLDDDQLENEIAWPDSPAAKKSSLRDPDLTPDDLRSPTPKSRHRATDAIAAPVPGEIQSNRFYDTISRQIAERIQEAGQSTPTTITLLAARDELASPRVAINTGIALTRRQIKTLLVELDHHQLLSSVILPELSESTQGIYDWLAGQVEELPVYHSPLKNLLFTPTGQQSQSPQVRQWSDLKKIDKTELDCILIYCPNGFRNGEADLQSMSDLVIGMTNARPSEPAPESPRTRQYLGTIDWLNNQWSI